MSGKKVICYHGTNVINARRIRKEGFKSDTWFALHLESAIKFGGNHIFGVVFAKSKVPDSWEFHVGRRIPSSRIVFYKIFKIKEVIFNSLLEEEIFESNIPKGKRALAREEFEREQMVQKEVNR